MKKIIELEGRWKAYKYKSYIFYVFVFVFIVFLAFVGLFIKNQYQKHIAKNNIVKQNNTQVISNVAVIKDGNTSVSNSIDAISESKSIASSNSDSNTTASAYPSINFVCRKVISNKLMVRKGPSFKSQPVGHYSQNGIFCAENKNVNGLVQTSNGWISANDKFSEIIKVNMFVDSGFYKYRDDSSIIVQAPMQEIDVLNNKEATVSLQPDLNVVKSVDIAQNNTANSANHTESKPLINISSEKITKEREIELKINDFKNTNSYDTAIEIAEYYFSIKDYNNSIRWSLNASEADSKGKTKVQSFIIYAKSLYANGKKEQAIDVLNKYIAKTNSRDAIEALKNIRQGMI